MNPAATTAPDVAPSPSSPPPPTMLQSLGGVAAALPDAAAQTLDLCEAETAYNLDLLGRWLLWSVVTLSAAAVSVVLAAVALGAVLLWLLPAPAAAALLLLCALLATALARHCARSARARVGYARSAAALRDFAAALVARPASAPPGASPPSTQENAR